MLNLMLKVSSIRFDACMKSFSEGQYGFVNGSMWQIVPDSLQNDYEFFLVLWFLRVGLTFLQHRTPEVIFQRI
jgi:hypothetical protein